jgi:hypothetical protein
MAPSTLPTMLPRVCEISTTIPRKREADNPGLDEGSDGTEQCIIEMSPLRQHAMELRCPFRSGIKFIDSVGDIMLTLLLTLPLEAATESSKTLRRRKT